MCSIRPAFEMSSWRLADRYLYSPLWSADIHAEWMRSLLIDRPDLDAAVLERTRAVMDEHSFPTSAVTGYETVGLSQPGWICRTLEDFDRHVLAAAIRGQADVIVTGNLRHFPVDRIAPHGLAAQHPDTFVAGLFEVDPATVLAAQTLRDRLPGEDWNGWFPRIRGHRRAAAQSASLGERSPVRARGSRLGTDGIAASAARDRPLIRPTRCRALAVIPRGPLARDTFMGGAWRRDVLDKGAS